MKRLAISFPYLLFAFMALIILWSNVRERATGALSSAESLEVMATLEKNRITERPAPAPGICRQCGKVIARGAEPAGADTFQFCSQTCKADYLSEHIGRIQNKKSSRVVDPVCGMDVNPTWGIAYTYSGATFHFCTEMCRNAFAATPLTYIGERCMVCRIPVVVAKAYPATFLGNTYYLCTEEHRREFKTDPASFFMHRMWGIPNWLYYASIALVLIVSFGMFEGVSFLRKRCGRGAAPTTGDDRSENRINLMRFRPVKRFLLSRPARFAAQLIVLVFFVLIISVGLFGNQNPALNLAPLLTWTIWWCGLVVLIMFVGKAWCFVCPWDALTTWIEKLSFWKKNPNGLGLGITWPAALQNITLATVLFVSLTWFELGFNVTMRPAFTAWLGIAMFVMALVSAFLFDRKSFCRYGCLVGRVSGLYALFSGIEVRRKNPAVCNACSGKECYNGSATDYGCPTFEFPAEMTTNTYCTQCGECLKACPYNNMAVNLRPWGEDLKVPGKSRTDEAYMALLMLAITAFHGLTMTPVWADLTAAIEQALPLGRMGAFSLGMCIVMGFPILVYALFIGLSRFCAATADRGLAGRLSYHDYFVRYAYCLLPIALFYHLAHNLEHLLMEGPKVIVLLSDPFGWGWNLFSTAGIAIPPLASLDVLWILQVILVGVGHVYSLWAAQKISRHTFTDERAALRGQWPMLAVMIAFSIFSLWLLKQPMEMRSSAM